MSVPVKQMVPSPAAVWSAGNYADVSDRMIPGLGARLVELADVGPGHVVLDVAAGSGNATLPAATTGAAVTALDITPSLLAIGDRRASLAGLDVEWVLGDAQALPFADTSFDLVLSSVGVQFCPDRAAAASELVRVCRPGGRIALSAWTPEGFIGQVLAAVTHATLGREAQGSPLDWGSEDGLSGLFEAHVSEMRLQREHLEMPADSPSEWVEYMATAYGPLVRARAALEARGEWERFSARLCEIARAHDVSDGGGFAGRAEYLVAVVHL